MPPSPSPMLFSEPYITSVVPILIHKSIEYKKVQASYFNDSDPDFEVIEKQFTFSGPYIANDLINELELGRHDTTVVNIGTGDGKSFTARHLIKFYAENGYIILVACPFILLTNETCDGLKKIVNKDTKIVNYRHLTDNNLEEFIQANIHCITINCLMGNPGGDSDQHNGLRYEEQSKIKKSYLENLQKYCTDNNKQVIIFFDEIHAGINNFRSNLMKNLDAWHPLVKKVFIFSATYTEASNIVLGYLANKFTNKKMTIYNCERRKFPRQADLHINISKQRYSSKNIAPLFYLKRVIEHAISNHQLVNILVATRSLVEALTNPKSPEPLAKYICSLNPMILVGKNNPDDANRFDPKRINIGTTFNTGISIVHPQSTFIIITPVFMGPDSQKLASIFMDGTPAIVQAFARLRNGGCIHVFMNKPTHLIEGSYLDSAPTFLKNLKPAWYKDCNYQSGIVEQAYKSHNQHIRNLAKFGKIDWETLYYETKDHFILLKSQFELASKYEIFGKNVNPFIIWAACHNQFNNCTLKTINLIDEPSVKVEIREHSIIPDLRTLLSDDIQFKIIGMNDKEALKLLFEEIHTHKANDGNQHEKKEIIYKGKSVKFEHSKYHPAITRALINILYQLKYETICDCNTSSYILGNIFLAPACKLNHESSKKNNLKVAYSILGEVGQILKGYVIFDDPLILKTIDETFEKKICTALHELRENDFYIRNKIFSFLQTYHFTVHRDGSILHQNWDIAARHKILLNGLTDIFFKSESKMIKTKGKTHRERIIIAEKPIPFHPLDLTFSLTLDDYNCFLDNYHLNSLTNQFPTYPSNQIP
ncbi:MAG TPA: DEAD/DEAH box helicase family protein [Prolixibacteraceae bacterium]|nr:DEAD/DEAH box helicase family protein [Prolixibacteraceae bacterium]